MHEILYGSRNDFMKNCEFYGFFSKFRDIPQFLIENYKFQSLSTIIRNFLTIVCQTDNIDTCRYHHW